ncbi:hypothetical protein CTAYLR_009387 [Chrysophaeum taylorii]|uniref:Uncharacterized protein n=1 Tax=Chrysophaeum taylorii TaxID=2483200 RepID=A0AAD7UJU8_9STRA|nr:hypothetical protein CTAYLR_009387 [Chrysophaeum taylorii]
MTDIGSGWFEHLDPASGRKYYANAATQETRWDYPLASETVDTSDWDERLDPQSGRVYYYNAKTQETSWMPPPGYKGEATELEKAASTDPTKWQSRVDDATKRTYYYNTVTKETTWIKPPCLCDEQASNGTAPYEGFEMRKFAEENFQLFRKGLFKSKTDVDKVLRWKNEMIKTALLNLKDGDLNAEAVQMFRNVTGFMGDRGSGKARIDHCTKLLSNMLQSPEELRNELYCQIVKQTTENPSIESTKRGWQLLAVCLATFPPSPSLAPHVGWYVAQHVVDLPAHAAFCLRALQKIQNLGTRRELPTTVEVESTLRFENALIRIFFLDGKFVSVAVNSWTTAADCVRLVCDLLDVKTRDPFALFEVSADDEERVLDADERVLDLVAYWHRLSTEKQQQAPTQLHATTTTTTTTTTGSTFHFQFKVRYFLNVPDNDTAGVEMMYVQAKHDVVDARYPCSDQDAITLAALQLQEEFGDAPTDDCQYLKGNLGKYLNDNTVNSKTEADLEHHLLKLYAKLAGYSQDDARLSYLDYVKSWKIYGSTYFLVEPKQNRHFPPRVVLAVGSKGIIVVDPDTKDFLQEYPYTQLVTWGHSPSSFVLVTGDTIKQVKVFFKTEQGREINIMVKAYVDALNPPN